MYKSTFKINNNDVNNNSTKKSDSFDLLDITASLGYQTHRRSSRKTWSREDDQELITLINDALKQIGYEGGILDIKSIQESSKVVKLLQWDVICSKFSNKSRTPKDLKKRWTGSLDPNVKKGRWTKEEDELLLKSYEKHGPHWLAVAMEIEGRTEDQCAKRYVEVLDPSSKGRLRDWTLEEDLLLISKVKQYGTRWRCICKEMDSRPSLTCRNRWRKIITTVVRGQAPDVIVNAVKENKDLDLNQLIRESNNNNNNNKDPTDVENHLHKIKNESNKSNRGKQTADVRQMYDYTAGLSSTTTNSNNTVFSKIKHTSTPPPTTPQLSRLSNLLPPLSPRSRILQNNARSLTDLRNLTSNKIPPKLSPDISRIELNSVFQYQSPDNLTLHNKLAYNNNNNDNNNHHHPNYEYSSINANQNIISSLASTNTSFGSTPNAKKPTPHTSQTEWKFVLKDGKGLSISSGTISTSKLVDDLIEKAKKYSLKISLHQHIHHHYDTNLSHSKQNDFPSHIDPLLSHSQKNEGISTSYTSVSTSSTNISQLQNSVSPDVINRPTTNYAIDPISPQIGLFPRANNSNNNMNNPRQINHKIGLTGISNGDPLSPHLIEGFTPSSVIGNNIISEANHQFADTEHNSLNTNSTPTSAQTQQLPTSGSDTSSFIPMINGSVVVNENMNNRSSHFNYLPPTIRPQLESSDSQKRSGRNASLSTLLNPSPKSINGGSRKSSSSTSSLAQQKRKNKRSRRKSGNNEPVNATVNPNNGKNSDKRKRLKIGEDNSTKNRGNNRNSTDTDNNPASLSSPEIYEDGSDFWERLRTLADHSSSKNKNDNSLKDQPTGNNNNNNVKVKSLFNYNKNDDSHRKTENGYSFHNSDNENIDPLLPLNPS